MNRRNRVLLVLLLLLAAGAAAVEEPWRGDSFARTRAAIQPLFPGLERMLAGVVRVEISSGDAATRLDRGPAGWTVAERFGAPADLGRLADLLAGMVALTDRDTVSDNPERQAGYSVDDADGTRVRLLDAQGRPVADLISGGLRRQKVGSGEQARLEFYVRVSGGERVFLAPFRPPVALPRDWIDPAMMPAGIRPGQVDWIQRLERGGRDSWRAVRVPGGEDDAWRLVAPEPGPARPAACENFAATFAGLRALDVLGRAGAEGPGAGFDAPENVLRCGIGDLAYELQLGRPLAGGRAAWLQGSDFVYLLPEYVAEELRLALDDVLAAE